MPNSDSRVKVLVADSIAMSCHLLADALDRSEFNRAVAASTPKDVLQLLEKEAFDVVLVGVGLSKDPLDSMQFLRQLQTHHPEIGIVVLLDSLDRELVVEAFRSGARGVFTRSDTFEALCKCVRCVKEGQIWVSSAGLGYVLESLVEHGPAVKRLPGSRSLSKREEQITLLVAEGYSNREISERLALSEHTIKNYLFRVFEKLGVSTRVGLTLYALKQTRTSQDKTQPAKHPPLSESRTLQKNSNWPS